jgi:hypothetical protein
LGSSSEIPDAADFGHDSDRGQEANATKRLQCRINASAAPAGYLLGLTSFGWPLVVAGSLKGVYDVLLLMLFSHRRPPEEVQPGPATTGRRA